MSGRAAEFLALLDDELERRRQAALTVAGGDARQWVLLKTLDEMAARMRAAPEWREPTPAEQRSNARWVESWLRRHGYL